MLGCPLRRCSNESWHRFADGETHPQLGVERDREIERALILRTHHRDSTADQAQDVRSRLSVADQTGLF